MIEMTVQHARDYSSLDFVVGKKLRS
jgi:hypothetical protein